jgi:transposase
MSKKNFSEREMELLFFNPYVKSVSSKGIMYTEEFKHIFIEENKKGKLPRQIFEEHGLDIDIVGKHRLESAAKRWRAAYREHGLSGLSDSRNGKASRPHEKEVSLEKKNARLEAELNLLKAENELLKKIKLMERRVRNK